MLCDHCHREDAIVHIRGIDQNGVVRSLSLCATCALQEIMLDSAQADELLATFREAALLNPGDILKILQAVIGAKGIGEGAEAKRECCPECGLSQADLHRRGLLGCLRCLDFFQPEISKRLGRQEPFSYDTARSLDSTSRKYTEKIIPQESLRLLNARLSTAIFAEQYELASVLKAEIDDILAQLGSKREPIQRKGWGALAIRDEFALPEQTVANLPWLPKKKTDQPLVRLASFVSLSRNLQMYELPPFAQNINQSEELCELLSPLLNAEAILGNPSEFNPRKMSKKERLELLERALCSQDFLFRSHSTRLFLSRNERVSCLLNDLDHLCLRAWGSPEDLPTIFHQVGQFHEHLNRKIAFLEEPKIGYVSRNIFLCGSGLKFGLLLHLPCLAFLDRLSGIVNACQDLGLVLRFPHKNNQPAAVGGLAVLETADGQCVPGDRIATLLGISEKIAEYERDCREVVSQNFAQRTLLCDRIGRVVGNLRGMRLLEQQEAQQLLSWLWLGCEMGMLPWLSLEQIMQKITELATIPAVLYGQEDDGEKKLQMQYFLARRFRQELGGQVSEE